MRKDDRAIKKGFEIGGAKNVEFVKHGNGYRRVVMVVGGKERTVFKIPSTSTLDDAGLQRKARNLARRLAKQDLDTLTW